MSMRIRTHALLVLALVFLAALITGATAGCGKSGVVRDNPKVMPKKFPGGGPPGGAANAPG